MVPRFTGRTCRDRSSTVLTRAAMPDPMVPSRASRIRSLVWPLRAAGTASFAVMTVLAIQSAGFAQSAPATTSVPAPQSPAAAKRAETQAELDQIARDIKVSQEKQAQIARDIAAIDKDGPRLNEELVAAANREREAETNVAVSETKIAGIEAEADGVKKSLSDNRAALAEVLAALQRIGRSPPPAVLVRPEDALASVRSAILIGAVLPEMRGEVDKVAADLQRLVGLKNQSAAERDRFRQAVTDLKDEQTRIARLMDERQRSRGDQQKLLEDERKRLQDLTDKATSLRDLVARLDTDNGLRGTASPGTAVGPNGQPKQPDQKSVTGEPGNVVRLQPAIRFVDARGRMGLPAIGQIVKSFGEDDGAGGTMKGIRLATRDGARVTSPCDGSVMFAGAFRSYGKLLIIDGGDGYHVVMAGMDRIDVERGQFVLAGEPVGVMGARRLASTSPELAASSPLLYVEFRKDNTSIDPAPWWVRTPDEKVRG